MLSNHRRPDQDEATFRGAKNKWSDPIPLSPAPSGVQLLAPAEAKEMRSLQWTAREPVFLSSQPHHHAHNGFLITIPHRRRRRASCGQLDCPGPVLLLPRRLVSNRLCLCALHRRLGVKLLHPQRRRRLFRIRRLLLQE